MTVENKYEPIAEHPIMEAMQVAASLLPHVEQDLSSMTDLNAMHRFVRGTKNKQK